MGNVSYGISNNDKYKINNSAIPQNTVFGFTGDTIPTGYEVINAVSPDLNDMAKKYVANALKEALIVIGDSYISLLRWQATVDGIVNGTDTSSDPAVMVVGLRALSKSYVSSFKGAAYALDILSKTDAGIDADTISSLKMKFNSYANNCAAFCNDSDTTITADQQLALSVLNLGQLLPIAETEVVLKVIGILDVLEDNGLIKFTIDGTSYQAEDGMTWYEWCNSNYNTSTWVCTSSTQTRIGKGEDYLALESGYKTTACVASDVIIANHAYGTGSSSK